MRIPTLATMALAVASFASGQMKQWTPEEHAGLVCAVEAVEAVTAALQADAASPIANGEKLFHESRALEFFEQVFSRAFNTPTQTRRKNRDQVVAEMYDKANQAMSSVERAGLTGIELCFPPQSETVYRNFLVPDHPRVVGPHGDNAVAESHAEHATRYVFHVIRDLVAVARVEGLPEEAERPLSTALVEFTEAYQLMVRAWAISMTVVPPGDDAVIRQDLAAGSGLRPYDFFRALRPVELVGGLPNAGIRILPFSNRRLDTGAADHFFSGTIAWVGVMQTLATAAPDLLVDGFRGRNVPANGPTGLMAEIGIDIPDFWRAVDAMVADWVLFFHEIPAPPGGPQ